ncbi:hypothetical protein [Cumulibacter manganitolerans]|uniref:hypothetical protein n=1 Tax=Cumulibacter manganitolerans TaxID=1884992 RepID=UPI001297FF21|nr:hypothetical protein [Cumulibacter manganitolerans]
MKKIEYPDRLARPLAQALVDAARAHPANVRPDTGSSTTSKRSSLAFRRLHAPPRTEYDAGASTEQNP